MEPIYDYKEETKKWLKSKPTPQIRVGDQYQASIPVFCPKPRPQKPATQNIPEEAKLPVTKPDSHIMPVKSISQEIDKNAKKSEHLVHKRAEAEPMISRELKEDRNKKDKKAKIDE